MKNKILEIESNKNKKGLLNINRDVNGKLSLEQRPTMKSSGLYWIYTSYSLEDLCNSRKSSNNNAVNIPFLSKSRKDLRNVIKPTGKDMYWIVYNGIGGCKPNSTYTYDLGGRILQEFGDHKTTGSLKILGTSLNDLSRWRYTYVEIDYDDYALNKNSLETGWRLEYGWPILSKK
jgi:hypothetical protein